MPKMLQTPSPGKDLDNINISLDRSNLAGDDDDIDMFHNEDPSDLQSPLDPSLPLSDDSVLPPPPWDENERKNEESRRILVTPNPPQVGEQQNHHAHFDSMMAPPSEVASDGGGACGYFGHHRGGFTLRNYEDEINKLRRDNLNLKLRIYLLEERHGLLPKPAEKENVYRINLDLRVENETMKKDLAEKTKLLKAAYNALESQEMENLREKQNLESQLESLRYTLDTQCVSSNQGDTVYNLNKDNDPKQFRNNENKILDTSLSHVEVGDRSKALLFDAFGSMNMGKQDDVLEKMDELQNECQDKAKKIQDLEQESQEKAKKIEELEQEKSELQNELDEKDEDLAKETKAFDKMTKEFHNKIQELQDMVQDRGEEVRVMEEEMGRMREERESRSYENEQIRQLCDQKRELEAKLGKLEEEQNTIKAKLEKEVSKRDAALKKLKEEYESAKNKVREYRAKKGSDKSFNEEQSKKFEEKEKQWNEQVEKLQTECEQKRQEIEHLKQAPEEIRDNPELLDQKQREIERLNKLLKSQNPSEVLKEENDWLRSELISVRASALKTGASKALSQVTDAYTEAAKCYTMNVQEIVKVFRQRLMELVEFLQQLLSMESNGSLDFSCMSNSMRDALHKSIEESRRLSQSLSQSMMQEDLNETQASSILGSPADSLELPEFVLPNVELKFADDSETHMKDYEALIAELKENVSERIRAQQEVKVLKQEVEKLKTTTKQEQPRQRSRSKVLDSDMASFKSAKSVSTEVAPDHNSDSWSQPDKVVSQDRIGIKSKIPKLSSRPYNDSSSSENENSSEHNNKASKKLQAVIIQLNSRLVSTQEKSEHEMFMLKNELEQSEQRVKWLKEEKSRLTSQLTLIKGGLDKNIASVMEEMDSVVDENRNLSEKLREMKSLQKELTLVKEEREEMRNKMGDLMKEMEVVRGHYKNVLNEVQQQDERCEHHQEEIKALVEQKLLLEELIENQKKELERNNKSNEAVLVCSNNKQEHEICHQRQPLGEIRNNSQGIGTIVSLEAKQLSKSLLSSSCGCRPRIEELERLLRETRTMYDEAQEKIRAEKERKEKIAKAAKVQLKKTKSVLKHSNPN